MTRLLVVKMTSKPKEDIYYLLIPKPYDHKHRFIISDKAMSLMISIGLEKNKPTKTM